MALRVSDQHFIRALAQRGATSRLEELREEMATLEKLIGTNGSNGHASFNLAKSKGPAQTAPGNTPRKKPGKRGWSAAARRAQSKRAKALWAAKKKADKAEAAAK